MSKISKNRSLKLLKLLPRRHDTERLSAEDSMECGSLTKLYCSVNIAAFCFCSYHRQEKFDAF